MRLNFEFSNTERERIPNWTEFRMELNTELKDIIQPKQRGVKRGSNRFIHNRRCFLGFLGYCVGRQGLSIHTTLDTPLLWLDNTFNLVMNSEGMFYFYEMGA
jgi:hypothetical protein